ncbi:hypothetical protein EG329_014185 [Mollisiaceae sp. DMI_Dod_QoI]|nr:hypothetical protein EG329_014185 [Helotiales sp. DMI_Dod_QoI]
MKTTTLIYFAVLGLLVSLSSAHWSSNTNDTENSTNKTQLSTQLNFSETDASITIDGNDTEHKGKGSKPKGGGGGSSTAARVESLLPVLNLEILVSALCLLAALVWLLL